MNREVFLHPPPLNFIQAYNDKVLIDTARPFDLDDEAYKSSLIENEGDNPLAIQGNRDALIFARGSYLPVSSNLLLEVHRILMKDHAPNMKPGQFRTVGVRVGRHIAPEPALVPILMAELDSFLRDESISPVLKAIWGHIQFETIHPFMDGNGRTGRALVNAVLPDRGFAPGVWDDRQGYYNHLDRATWHEWWTWASAILEGREPNYNVLLKADEEFSGIRGYSSF